ncbi:MAG TPA: NUDIX hydrolase [Bacteroidales bacterium]|jgi:ADP-ribose pyrophosphatase YjhB (NUDIX family)|nr:NUDIX hydrolase [Bacteroidales bacterium]HQJ81737.1 NUDIX hydrolase [Bacteroidales bacterium]
MKYKWLDWVIQIQSIAQAGLAFAENQYDADRYRMLRDLSVEIMHHYTEVSHEKLRDLFAGETGYQTPKVDVRASVISDDRILLVREKIDGKWALPGGWADVNSSVSESVERECLEEAGVSVIPERIIALQLAGRHNDHPYPYTIYKVFVECKMVSGSFRDNTETFAAGFFSRNDLPGLSTERTTRKQIDMCFEAHGHTLWEPVFD